MKRVPLPLFFLVGFLIGFSAVQVLVWWVIR